MRCRENSRLSLGWCVNLFKCSTLVQAKPLAMGLDWDQAEKLVICPSQEVLKINIVYFFITMINETNFDYLIVPTPQKGY